MSTSSDNIPEDVIILGNLFMVTDETVIEGNKTSTTSSYSQHGTARQRWRGQLLDERIRKRLSTIHLLEPGTLYNMLMMFIL